MAIQSELFNTSLNTRVFVTTKHIATKQHMAVWLYKISNSTWEQLSVSSFELINNSAVLTTIPDSTVYSQVEIRVADEPNELGAGQSDIAKVASISTDITSVANTVVPNIDEILLADTNASIATTKASDAEASAFNANNSATQAFNSYLSVITNTQNAALSATNASNSESVVVEKEGLVSPHYTSIDTVSNHISAVETNAKDLVGINRKITFDTFTSIDGFVEYRYKIISNGVPVYASSFSSVLANHFIDASDLENGIESSTNSKVIVSKEQLQDGGGYIFYRYTISDEAAYVADSSLTIEVTRRYSNYDRTEWGTEILLGSYTWSQETSHIYTVSQNITDVVNVSDNLTNILNSATEAVSSVSGFQDVVDAETATFNSNATAKTTSFDNNAITQTINFDNNATTRTTAFNNNATIATNAITDIQTSVEATAASVTQITGYADVQDVVTKDVKELYSQHGLIPTDGVNEIRPQDFFVEVNTPNIVAVSEDICRNWKVRFTDGVYSLDHLLETVE